MTTLSGRFSHASLEYESTLLHEGFGHTVRRSSAPNSFKHVFLLTGFLRARKDLPKKGPECVFLCIYPASTHGSRLLLPENGHRDKVTKISTICLNDFFFIEASFAPNTCCGVRRFRPRFGKKKPGNIGGNIGMVCVFFFMTNHTILTLCFQSIIANKIGLN